MNIRILALHELRRILVSPASWVVTAFVYFIIGFLFTLEITDFLHGPLPVAMGFSHTEIIISPVLSNLSLIGVIIVPLITMRLISDERRSQTITLLFSAPVSRREIVLGKFVAVYIYLLLISLITMVIPLSILLSHSIEWGTLFCAVIGTALLMAVYAAVGLYTSVLTSLPVISAVYCLMVLVILWMIEWAQVLLAPSLMDTVRYLSVGEHFYPFLSGEFNTNHILYFLLITIFFLFLSVRHLEGERLQT